VYNVRSWRSRKGEFYMLDRTGVARLFVAFQRFRYVYNRHNNNFSFLADDVGPGMGGYEA
jgi:hypothetical protein